MSPRKRPDRPDDSDDQAVREQEVLRANRELAAYFRGRRTEREARSALRSSRRSSGIASAWILPNGGLCPGRALHSIRRQRRRNERLELDLADVRVPESRSM